MPNLVWGFGDYYKKKESSIQKETISAFVSTKEFGNYKGIEIISASAILQHQFDKLYIMAGEKNVFEIISELKKVGYKEWGKIVLGWKVKPYMEDEKILLEEGDIFFDSAGTLVYGSGERSEKINTEKDLHRLKQRIIRSKKRNDLSDISCIPASRIFGVERGLPIDRFFIEKFLRDNSCYIRGTVLEVARREYTQRFGKEVKSSYIMHVCEAAGENSIIANLETGEGVIAGLADCFILTQTLPFIFDVKKAAESVVKFLKEGGVALITVSGITQISRYDMERWGHYWSFTTASLKKLFEMCDDVVDIKVSAYGNVKSATYGLYGLVAEEIDESDLLYQDDDYQQIITAVVRKGFS